MFSPRGASRRRFRLLLLLLCLTAAAGTCVRAQNGIIRGKLFDAADGAPVPFATVQLSRSGSNEPRGTNTDAEGFFSFSQLTPGEYRLLATFVGYDSTVTLVTLSATNEIEYLRLLLDPAAVSLTAVQVSARRQRQRDDVAVSRLTVMAEDILNVPAVGGTPDLAQYLSVLPGVVSSGDQGGQLYIRGGSPVQNKILLDGMTLYNPFHSIGLFSVFETEAIGVAEVHTAGFNAEYGGRISAIVDLSTRAGNKRRLAGLAAVSPFQARALVEGPLRPLGESGGSVSFLLTGKQSLLPYTGERLYGYAAPDNFFTAGSDSTATGAALPYDYRDLYGKLTVSGGNGSQLDLFGFRFTDDFSLGEQTGLNWSNAGGGGRFTLVPPTSDIVIDGVLAASAYNIALREGDRGPRSSGIAHYTARLDFTWFGGADQLAYGFEFNGINTDFTFLNDGGVTFRQEDFTSELNGYARYKRRLGDLIVEPGLRVQYYASLNTVSVEPRLGMKYALNDGLRLKAAGGWYSQNLIATQNDLDIVNFFQGYLVGPESSIAGASDNLQRAVHAVGGLEWEASSALTLNLEGYYKGFTRLLELNRGKLRATDPDFVALSGTATGADVALEYRSGGLRLAGNYGLAWVNRTEDGVDYPTSYDRRHTVNLYGSHEFGPQQRWNAGFRFTFGSAFPFTQTLGIIQDSGLDRNPVLADFLTGNGSPTVLLSADRNGGRLSDLHRLDLSLTRTLPLGGNANLEITGTVTNAYNRENTFYVDRLRGGRVNQLPLLPALAATLRW
ncbi:TonB-dependent receptor [Neolewinella marina]|uniref:TonB-dependent receptor n=1 Tax=Neolewinella marina TaxID=438751 RepID=A0A2G0CHM0_9BACT|nr:TonB-dependent receptor [Neolewinella marina]